MITVTFRGVNYQVPEPSDAQTQSLTDYLNALSTGTVPFPTTADIDLGSAFGLKSLYYKGRNSNPAASGIVRLSLADLMAWRNNANNADLALGVGAQDQLQWRGSDLSGNPMLDASTTAGQSIPNNAATIVVFGTVARDSDSAYNSGTGRYTVPAGKGGDYLITGAVIYVSAITGTVNLAIFKNAVASRTGQTVNPGITVSIYVSAVQNLAAGDIIDLRTFQNSGGAVALSTAAGFSYFTLKRIPV